MAEPERQPAQAGSAVGGDGLAGSAKAEAGDTKAKSAAQSAASAPAKDVELGCSKEVGPARASFLWQRCMEASADRAPENLQKEHCYANQSKPCSQLYRGIQDGCLTGEAPAFCNQLLREIADVTCNIKSIDWKNQQFPLGFFKLDARESTDNFLRTSKGHAGDADRSVTVSRVIHTDLDSDGATEAVVASTLTPRPDMAPIQLSMVSVFEGDKECNVRPLDTIRIADGLTTNMLTSATFSVEDKRIVGTWDELDPAKSEDRLKVRTTWTLTGKKLKEGKRRVERVPGGNSSGQATPNDPRAESKPKAKDEKAKTKQEGKDDKAKSMKKDKAKKVGKD